MPDPRVATSFDLARDHAISDVPVVEPGDSKAEILTALTARRYFNATHFAVCTKGILLGIIRIEDFLSAPPEASAVDIMDPDPLKVENGIDQEVAAWKAVQHGETALAVVDGEGRFLGIIPPLALLQVLNQEHEEDLSRLGGYLKTTAKVRTSALENVLHRFWHRLPWLILGLFGALFSADVVGRFETVLADHILLAFFIPAIVYLADAVGTQTETVIVRGMSVGVGLRQVVLMELLTGLFIGMIIASVAFFIVLWRWGQVNTACGISLSIFAACSTASATAMILPWALNRIGLDPAYGSGPLATVIQDVLSILIYFAIATRFL
jgi:magnesium transporter